MSHRINVFIVLDCSLENICLPVEYNPCFALVSFNSGTEIVDTRLLWKQETVHKTQDFIWWSEVLDVRGLWAESFTERLVEELAARTVEHQLILSVAPDLSLNLTE